MERLDVYKAILKVAQEGGYLKEFPDESQVEAEGIFYVQAAQEAYDGGQKKDKTIKAILNLYKQIDTEDKDIFGAPLKDTFRGMPVPADPQHDPTDVPSDFTELGDKQVRRLHSEYTVHAARARWMVANVVNKHADAVHLRDREYRKLFVKHTAEIEKNDKRATKDLVESRMSEDDKFVQLEDTVKMLKQDVESYKALLDIYNSYVERLSREWTMRTEENRHVY